MDKIIIVVATGNQHKLGEYKDLFSDYPHVEFKCIKDIVSHDIDIVENSSTFVGNSIIKAKALLPYTNEIIIADDSGLEIDALDGFPGIYSARFMKDAPYEEKWAAVLEKLKDKEDRGAQFHCALSLLLPGQIEPIVFEGIERGYIIEEVHGLNGFGYDPIFMSSTLGKTFGDATEEEKNSVSHRGRATAMLKEYLIKNKII
ncbi:MAG: RdgB/HAM1 family non-canonical purine NTP pyrophosphatase [Bacilli bacterium]|nr:RdgB/HAM1 family non-canonical purine NTP pyrophosphatase [Bacilli bacterium]